MSEPRPATPRMGVAQPAILVLVLSAGYFISQFLRAAPGVILPDLQAEFGLDAGAAGRLSSVFFLSFAAMQIPLGIAIDRFGARICLTVSFSLAVLGCLGMAHARSGSELMLARAVTGIGCSAAFMGALAIFARWFITERFSTMTGILLALGTLGTLVASQPMAFLADAWGWRSAFLIAAGLALLIGGLIFLIARDAPQGMPLPRGHGETLTAALRGLRDVSRIPSIWRLFAMHFVAYACFATIFVLWAGPYLRDVHGHDLQARGVVMLLLAAGQVCGLFFWGPTDRLFRSYRVPVLTGSALVITLLLVLAWQPLLRGAWLNAWFFAYGFACGFHTVLTAHGRLVLPPALIGRGLTFLNLATMGGVFLWQWATGEMVNVWFVAQKAGDRLQYPPEAYQAVFVVLAALLLLACLIYAPSRDQKTL